ncbi:MAG: ABC transporter ATP-binding protein [Flavobacteriales bacterium]|nr:ABC transporter ATP-binding protein [Bacteroidota bacterium]MCB9241084.1 ABC transporter ATP-binding protein [Flavobacteriales bacterium]
MRPLLYLNKYFIKYRWYLILGIIFIICSNIFAILIAPVVRTAIDSMIDNIRVYNMLDLGAPEIASHVARMALYFGGLVLVAALIKGVFMYFMRQTIIVMSRKIEFDLKNEIFSQYQRLGASFYNRNYTGDLMNRISEDVSQVRMYLGPAIMYTINLVFLFILVISVMVSINPEITLYVLLPLPILSISIYYVSEIINKRSAVLQAKLSGITTYVQEAFSGIRVLKAFAAEPSFTSAFEDRSEDYKQQYMRLVQVNALFFPLTMMLIGLSVIITIYFGGKQVIEGTFSFGNIAEYVIYVNMLTWPVASLGWVTSIIQRASASQERINAFLDEEPERTSGNPVQSFNNSIRFEHVSFTYSGTSKAVLKDLNFEIKKGQTIGIIGTTGSGKSTLASLLLRLYEPNDGSIFLDNHPIGQYDLIAYRSLWGYVPQDIFLFSESIRENILFGREDLNGNDAETFIQKYASMADVWKDIESFPKQLNTILGERGITLSGGQKQRVAIARALIREPELLLFDDSLSAVDTHTERTIKQNLKSYMKDRTVILVSHRVSSVEDADHLLVMDDGRIAEQGSPSDLIKSGGLFAAMVELQSSQDSVPTAD